MRRNAAKYKYSRYSHCTNDQLHINAFFYYNERSKFSPCADFELLHNAYNFAKSKGIKTHVGNIYSSDTFYDERPDLNEQMVRHGIMAVEMEAAELYTLAARFNRKALAILTVSDHLQTGEALPSDEREKTFAQMIDMALAAAFPAK